MAEEVTFRARLTATNIDWSSGNAMLELGVVPTETRLITVKLAEVPDKEKGSISRELGLLLETLINNDGSHRYVDVTLRPAKDE